MKLLVRVDDAAEAVSVNRRHRFAHQIEDRHAVHHGALEQESRPIGFVRESA